MGIVRSSPPVSHTDVANADLYEQPLSVVIERPGDASGEKSFTFAISIENEWDPKAGPTAVVQSGIEEYDAAVAEFGEEDVRRRIAETIAENFR